MQVMLHAMYFIPEMQMIKRSTLEISTYAASLRPSFTSFCGTCQLFIPYFHS